MHDVLTGLQKLEAMCAAKDSSPLLLAEFAELGVKTLEQLTLIMHTGSRVEKQEILRVLSLLEHTLTSIQEQLCQNAGKTNDEILAYMENPSNFSIDTWSALQKMLQVADSAREQGKHHRESSDGSEPRAGDHHYWKKG